MGDLAFSKQLRKWRSQLVFPDWYVRLEEEIIWAIGNNPSGRPTEGQITTIYSLISEFLWQGDIPLAQTGPNFDRDRQVIDRVIIHQTSRPPLTSIRTLSAIGLLRQYAHAYLTNNILGNKLRGQPIWSGHFLDGVQMFASYHWLIEADGTSHRMLDDRYIGWHAGDWNINARSVGITLNGELENVAPTTAQIQSTAEIINTHYPQIPRRYVLGHCEIKENRICPGRLFLTDWKQNILDKIKG